MPILSLSSCFPLLPFFLPCLSTHLPPKCPAVFQSHCQSSGHGGHSAGETPGLPDWLEQGACPPAPTPRHLPQYIPRLPQPLAAQPSCSQGSLIWAAQAGCFQRKLQLATCPRDGPSWQRPSGRLSPECGANGHSSTCFPGLTVGPQALVKRPNSSGEPGRAVH